MTNCLSCKHFIPKYTKAEFAAARLLNNTNTRLEMQCASHSEAKLYFSLNLNYYLKNHTPNCERYIERST